MKKLFFIILFIFLFTTTAYAEEPDIYKEQLENSGILEIEDMLPQDVREYINKNGLDISDYNWINNIKTENVFSHILAFLKSGLKKPLISLGIITAIIIINALLFEKENSEISPIVTYAATISIAGAIITPIFAAINTATGAMKACAAFMTAFIPIFAAITAATGKAVTSVSMSALLLGAANGVSLLSNFGVIPFIGGYLSLSLSAGVSPFMNGGGISQAVKKLALWVLSLITTVFLGILSIQTVVNAHADNLSMRTAKFIVGSAVPVAGGVLSEALGTLTASMSLLKSTVGIYGVVICCLIFLPIIIELVLWRITLWISDFVALQFSLSKISGLLQSLDTVLSVLIGIILLTAAMFIISLSVVMGSVNV